jgi:hypothetical protein
MQFAMNLIGACTSAIMSWVAVSLSDRMPRRKGQFITFVRGYMLVFIRHRSPCDRNLYLLGDACGQRGLERQVGIL